MSQTSNLSKAAEAAARRWPAASGEVNLVDLYWLAQQIREDLGVALPTVLPPQNKGVRIFECVETHLLRDPHNRLVRQLSAGEVAQRIETIANFIKGHRLLPFSDEQNVVVALYMWHGCVHMAKVLRKDYVTHSGLAPYTPKMRREGYEFIRECWVREEA